MKLEGRDAWWRGTAERPRVLRLVDASAMYPLIGILFLVGTPSWVFLPALTLTIILVALLALMDLFFRVSPKSAALWLWSYLVTMNFTNGTIRRNQRWKEVDYE